MALTDILSGASLGVNLVKTAYDKYVEFALRSFPLMRNLADKRPVDQSMPGDSITFNLYADLSAATTPLTENVDPTAVAVPQTTTVSVTLNEYGSVVTRTRKLALFAFSEIDPAIVNLVAFNQVNSLDQVVRDVISAGTNVTRNAAGVMTFNTGTAANVEATDFMRSDLVRASVTKLRGRNAVPGNGSAYFTLIHPDVSFDLRSEAGASASWRTPHENSAPAPIWAGMIGEYEGSVFVETPRTKSATDGASSATVHRTIMVGKQCLAEAVAEEPNVRIGPVVDPLMRYRHIGWYAVLGWSIYRQDAIQRIETSSSLA